MSEIQSSDSDNRLDAKTILVSNCEVTYDDAKQTETGKKERLTIIETSEMPPTCRTPTEGDTIENMKNDSDSSVPLTTTLLGDVSLFSDTGNISENVKPATLSLCVTTTDIANDLLPSTDIPSLPNSPSIPSMDPAAASILPLDSLIPKAELTPPLDGSPAKGFVASRRITFTKTHSVPNVVSVRDVQSRSLDESASSMRQVSETAICTPQLDIECSEDVVAPPLDGSPAKGFVASRRQSFTKHNSVPNLEPILKSRSGSFYQKVVDEDSKSTRWSLTGSMQQSPSKAEYDGVCTEEEVDRPDSNSAEEDVDGQSEDQTSCQSYSEDEKGEVLAHPSEQEDAIVETSGDSSMGERVECEKEDEVTRTNESLANDIDVANPAVESEPGKHLTSTPVPAGHESGCCRCM